MSTPPFDKLEALAELGIGHEELAIATRLAFAARKAGIRAGQGRSPSLILSPSDEVAITQCRQRPAIARRLEAAAERLGLRLQSSATA